MKRLTAFIFTYRGAFLPLALLPAATLDAGPQGTVKYLIGLPLIVLGVSFRLLGVRGIGGRARVHSAGARRVVTQGIFGHVRNPLYLGNALAFGGVSALYFSVWGTPLVIGYILALYTLIVLYEERCLLQQFGEAYRRYMEGVPRWHFRWSPYTDSTENGSPVSWMTVLKNERYFLAGYVALSLIASIGITESAGYRAIPFTGMTLLVAAGLFIWIASKLQRRRGSWLAVDRTSGGGRSLEKPVKQRPV